MGYVATMIVRLIVLGIGCALLYLSYDFVPRRSYGHTAKNLGSKRGPKECIN